MKMSSKHAGVCAIVFGVGCARPSTEQSAQPPVVSTANAPTRNASFEPHASVTLRPRDSETNTGQANPSVVLNSNTLNTLTAAESLSRTMHLETWPDGQLIPTHVV